MRIEAPQGGQQQQNREFGTVSINGRDLSTEMVTLFFIDMDIFSDFFFFFEIVNTRNNQKKKNQKIDRAWACA